MKNFYPTKSLAARMHKPIYLVGLLWFDRTVHNLSLCAGLHRIFQYTDLSSHWPFPVKVYTNPTSLWTIGFMLWKTQLLCGLVDWQNVPTQLLNVRHGTMCCDVRKPCGEITSWVANLRRGWRQRDDHAFHSRRVLGVLWPLLQPIP